MPLKYTEPDLANPYTGPVQSDTLSEIFLSSGYPKADERLWGLLGPRRWSRPLFLNLSQGHWKAVPGSYIYEPPGDIRTLVVENNNEKMVTLFHNTGAIVYWDEAGNTTETTDVLDRIQACRSHFDTVRPGAGKAKDFIH